MNTASSRIQSDQDMGQIIRARRKALGMSQEMMSSLTGIAQPNLSNIERGKSDTSLATYLRLCALLGIDLMASMRS